METRDLNYWTKRINEYVNKSKLHLWVDDKNRFFKIIPFEVDGKQMVTSITFGDGYFRMGSIDSCVAKSSQSLFFMKDGLFPQWLPNKVSIPNFRRMKELTAMVKEILETGYKSSDDLKKVEEKIRKLVEKEVFIKKEECEN